jgi:hypothetical protein
MHASLRMLLVLPFLVLFAGNPVHASTPELPIGDTVLGAAPFDRWQPAIAANGSEMFAVWTDSRVPMNRVVGTRLDENGTVIDRTGILISGDLFAPAFRPAVVWNGSFWMVFWTCSMPGPQQWGLIAARVDRDGHLAGAPYMLAQGASGEGQYVASNGDTTVVAYTENSGTAAHALVLDRGGNLVRDLRLPTPSVNLEHASVATDGAGFLVAWYTQGSPEATIEGVRLDASGNLRDQVPTILGIGREPFLASDGTNYLLLSRRAQTDDSLVWATTPIAHDLTVGATDLLPDGRTFQSPSLFYRNGNYFVVGQRNSDITPKFDIAAVLVSPEGFASQPFSLADLRLDSVDPQAAATITSTGKLAVIWNELAANEEWKVLTLARLFDGVNRASSVAPLLLSGSGNPHYSQAIAYGKGMFAIAWRGYDALFATRVTVAGRAVDGAGIRLESRGWTNPAVAFDGSDFVVAYAIGKTLHLRFVSPESGLRTQRIEIPLANDSASERPALAVAPDATYVAWVDGAHVMATRIPHLTRVPDTPVKVSPAMAVTQPQLAWNGTQLLAAWGLQEFIVTPPISSPSIIYGARITATLTLLDPAPLVLIEGDGGYFDPALSSNGKDWLCVWQHNASIEGRRVFSDGTLGTPAVIEEDGWLPVLAFDGARYAFAWKESDPRATLRLASLTRDGEIVRSGLATIAATDTRPYGAALAPTPNGIAAAYARVSNTPEHGGVPRTFMRMLKGKKRAAGR